MTDAENRVILNVGGIRHETYKGKRGTSDTVKCQADLMSNMT